MTSRLPEDVPHGGAGPVVVIGAGLVGCLAAACLAQRGLHVLICERHGDLRTSPVDDNRPSINLTLCARGLRALAHASVLESVRPWLVPAFGRIVHQTDGTLSYQQYGGPGDAIYAVRRKDLNAILLDQARALGVEIRFRHSCVDVDPQTGRVMIEGPDDRMTEIDAACVFAADGASSRVRVMLARRGQVHQSIEWASTGYKAVTIARNGPQWRWPGDGVHVWPRHRCLAVGFSNCDGSHSIGLHLPMVGEDSFEELQDRTRAERLLAGCLPDAFPLLRASIPELVRQRANAMSTVRCRPWRVGRVLLIGDAAHAILPHFGQGANAGFEDCQTLAELVDRHGPDWPTVFASFEEIRAPDAAAIADMCSDHAHTLHYDADSPEFARYLELERTLQELCPDRVRPLYSMIAFSSMGYSEVRARATAQRRVITELLAQPAVDVRLSDPAARASWRDQIERELPVITEPTDEQRL
jgi:kynurenine 3-monooxygenase